MKKYLRPEAIVIGGANEGVFLASGSEEGNCLQVTSWEDHKDGETYRFVFKVTHTVHQSYEQTVTATFSIPVTVTETDGLVDHKMLDDRTVELVRHNQLNSTGLVELWVKLTAASQPTVLNVTASNCKRTEN
ncbi:MAG: hypothetical protein IJ733_04575 [Lachnospiraceae bacterium]|nr:hypothetical protein [Lachnospiraceae bacterium]